MVLLGGGDFRVLRGGEDRVEDRHFANGREGNRFAGGKRLGFECGEGG
jgi:hypothetical protein